MTRCESYPLCFGTIYFPTAPVSYLTIIKDNKADFSSRSGSEPGKNQKAP